MLSPVGEAGQQRVGNNDKSSYFSLEILLKDLMSWKYQLKINLMDFNLLCHILTTDRTICCSNLLHSIHQK